MNKNNSDLTKPKSAQPLQDPRQQPVKERQKDSRGRTYVNIEPIQPWELTEINGKLYRHIATCKRKAGGIPQIVKEALESYGWEIESKAATKEWLKIYGIPKEQKTENNTCI